MNKNELILFLAKVRMKRYWTSKGYSEPEATKIVVEAFELNPVSPDKALSLPEGGLVTIVETYLNSMRAAGGWPWRGDLESFDITRKTVLGEIERYRSSLYGGQANFPHNDLNDYVFYRMEWELPKVFGKTAADYGMDKETTDHLIFNASQVLLKVHPGLSDGSRKKSAGSKACFVATACYGSPDNTKVIILRKYRDTVLRKGYFGRTCIFWYYRFSPPIAILLRKNTFLKIVIRSLLGAVAAILKSVHHL